MKYSITKTFAPNKGYPCVYRQAGATSHCHWQHGYDLIFEVTFEANILDDNGWVLDLGDLGYLKERLEKTFDHKTIVAEDDPALKWYQEGRDADYLNLVILPQVGLEFFACWLAVEATDQIQILEQLGRVRVRSARVYEHAANMAEYTLEHKD